MQLRGVVLVEGTSDVRAVETLARRRGRDLQAEGIAIVPLGGYGNLPRVLGQHGDVRLAGLHDVGEERHFLRALACDERGELERVGFYACTRDLEDDLTRAVGSNGMERVLVEQGELRAFRTYQMQPAHRARPLEEQLYGFMWNRKQKYAVLPSWRHSISSSSRDRSTASCRTSSSAPAGEARERLMSRA